MAEFQDSQISQLSQSQPYSDTEEPKTVESWEEFSQDHTTTSLFTLFKELNEAPETGKAKEELENILTSAASKEETEEINDSATYDSTVTSITNTQNDPESMQYLDHITVDLIGFMKTRDTIQEYADYLANVKSTTTKIMDTVFKTIKQNTELSTSVVKNAANTLGHVGKFLDELAPKTGLDIEMLQKKLNEKIDQQMQEKAAQFTNIRANVENILQETTQNIIRDEATPKAQVLITELNNYETSMNKLMTLYQTKELSNENKKKILSLWNQLMSLNELIKDYNASKSYFSTREFDVIVEYFQNLTLDINKLNGEFEGFPDKVSDEEPPRKKRFFGIFGGKQSRQTKKTNKQSKKNKLKKGGKSNKSKKNRRTKRKNV